MKEMIEVENRIEHNLIGYTVEKQENFYTAAVKEQNVHTTP
jgi:hypothetical protein